MRCAGPRAFARVPHASYVPQLRRHAVPGPVPRSVRPRSGRRLLRPEAKRRYSGQILEILVSTEHHKLVPNAKLREKRINRSDLKAAAAALVTKVCSGNVIFALGYDQWQDRK